MLRRNVLFIFSRITGLSYPESLREAGVTAVPPGRTFRVDYLSMRVCSPDFDREALGGSGLVGDEQQTTNVEHMVEDVI